MQQLSMVSVCLFICRVSFRSIRYFRRPLPRLEHLEMYYDQFSVKVILVDRFDMSDGYIVAKSLRRIVLYLLKTILMEYVLLHKHSDKLVECLMPGR